MFGYPADIQVNLVQGALFSPTLKLFLKELGNPMNPYSRFRLVSISTSAAMIAAGLCAFGQPVFTAISAAAGTGAGLWIGLAGAVTVLVVFWLALTEAIVPSLFRFDVVRRAILGKYYIEGTWLQAERGTAGGNRLSVIDIQPSGESFIFSGYALNKDLEIESNMLIEFSKFEWPFMTYKYRNSLSDGSDGQRDGLGEIQFEMNRAAANRYNGFVQFAKTAQRIKIEGAKLTRDGEVKRLRKLENRKAVLEKYWTLFFNTSLNNAATGPLTTSRPVIIDAAPSRLPERRTATPADLGGKVVPRRRATDWRTEETTPAAGRIPARMQAQAEEIDEEDRYEEAEAELSTEIEQVRKNPTKKR